MKNFNTDDLNGLSKTGIYKITNITTNKVYIGAAAGIAGKTLKRLGIYRRWMEHIRDLNNDSHRNRHLQSAWNLYGQFDFVFDVIEFCTPEECQEREIFYIDLYDSCNHNKGYNMIRQSNLTNNTFSDEHKKKISNSLLGKKRPQNVVKKWSKEVIQLDRTGKIILNTYYSMAEASRQTGIQRQDIGQSIIGKKCKTAGGFKWKLVEDIV